MEPLETTLLPWAQGVGRSNRPAPTIPPAGSKIVLRSAADRHHLSFASTVCFHCVLPLCASTVCFHCVLPLCRNRAKTRSVRLHYVRTFRFHLRADSAFRELRASSEASS